MAGVAAAVQHEEPRGWGMKQSWKEDCRVECVCVCVLLCRVETVALLVLWAITSMHVLVLWWTPTGWRETRRALSQGISLRV